MLVLRTMKKQTTIASQVAKGEVDADAAIFIPAAMKLAKDVSVKIWQRSWERAQHGDYTRQLITNITWRMLLPNRRCS